MEPKSGLFNFMSRFTRPSDTITDKQVEILLDAPGVRFPPKIKERLSFYIKKQWATRPGKKSAFDLFKESGHPCTHEYFNKIIKGDDSHPPFEEKINQKLEVLKDYDPKNARDKQTIDDITRAIDIEFSEISKIFTEGFFSVLKDNLLFRKGKPIAVREGDDRKRFGQCHAKLTEDDYEQSSRRFGPDEEAEGVAGKAFEGHGKTRRRRRKGKKNKTKARKMRSRR